MDVLLSLEGPTSAADLESLYRWLRGEPELGPLVRLEGSEPEPGALGSVLDVVATAAGSTGVLTVLASALKSWLSVPRGASLRIRLRDGDLELDVELTNLEKDRVEQLAVDLVDRGLDRRDRA
jgi:Effector Associated Constant Component 1